MSEGIRPDDGVVSIELGVTRRKLMKQLGAVGLTAGLAGCGSLRDTGGAENEASVDGSGSGDTAAQEGGGNGGSGGTLPEPMRVPLTPPPTADSMNLANPTHEEREMVFVNHAAGQEFWIPCIAGMNDGLRKNGWKGRFIGPAQNDPGQQVETLQTTLNQLRPGKDIIATSVLDENQYKAPIKKAIDNDIPVLTYNTTISGWDFNTMMNEFGTILPYVGQKMVRGGVGVGLTAYERAKKQLDQDTITALPTIAVPDHPALSSRVEGARMAFEAQSDTEVLETLNISNDLSKAISRIKTKYSSNNEIDVIVGSGWWGPVAGGDLVESQGLEDELIVGGFDLPTRTLQGIKDGTINFTAGQDPYSQGYMPTQLAWEFMERGIPMKDYITGLSIVDETNIDFAMNRSGKWKDLQNWQNQNYDL